MRLHRQPASPVSALSSANLVKTSAIAALLDLREQALSSQMLKSAV